MNYLPRPNTSAEIKIFSEMFSGHFRRCWTRINIARRFRTPIQIYPDAERSSIGKRHHRGNHVQHRRSGHQSKDVQPGQCAKQRRLRTSFVPRAHDDEWRGWRFWRRRVFQCWRRCRRSAPPFASPRFCRSPGKPFSSRWSLFWPLIKPIEIVAYT